LSQAHRNLLLLLCEQDFGSLQIVIRDVDTADLR